MILTIGVAAGLITGLVRAWISKNSYHVPQARHIWLVFLAFIPQLIAFVLPSRFSFPDEAVPVVLVLSQALLLVWILYNYRQPGFWLMGMGLVMNFLVIVLNGGMMPIRPQMVEHLIPNAPDGFWQVGKRLGVGKDIVLAVEDTHLWFLSDWFTLPAWLSYPVAFSLGDVLITVGAFLLLWSAGGREKDVSLEEAYE